MRLLLGLLTALFCVHSSFSQERRDRADQPPTHLAFLQSSVACAVSQILGEVKPPERKRVLLKVEKSEDSWIFEDKLIDALRDSGAVVFVDNSKRADDVSIWEFRVLEIGLRCARTLELEKEKFIEREASVGISGKIFDGYSGRVLWGNDLRCTQRDTIRADGLEELESQHARLSNVPVTPEGVFKSIIEPLVVIAASAMIIFLFFAVRGG